MFLPFYGLAAVAVEWLEFTPYEVGHLKYGASIRAEDFGSKFFMGRLVKRLSETRICYMQGDYCLEGKAAYSRDTWSGVDSPGKTSANRLNWCEFALARTFLGICP